jgi:hypothetical protein
LIGLRDVTLVLADCAAHDLARLALVDTLSQIEPAAVLIYSDRRILPDHDFIPTAINSGEEYNRLLWERVPYDVKTSHFLNMQWDGYVLDGDLWNRAWLDYDYIGAPWWYEDGLNVGNGGFCLRSTDMFRWIAEHPGNYPFGDGSDSLVCRTYRRQLEHDGFTWASQREAAVFSFERSPYRPTFGFHGVFNLPLVMQSDALRERLSHANDYVRTKPDWTDLPSWAREAS